MPVIESDSTKLADWVTKNFKRMEGNRVNWESYWEDIAKFFVPMKDDIYGQKISGQRRENLLYDNTSIRVTDTLASALHTYLTSPYSNFFGITTGDAELDAMDEVNGWLQEIVEEMLMVIRNSNFHTEIHKKYTDLPSFGTDVFRVEEDDRDIIKCHCLPIYQHYIQENHVNLVDTVYRKFNYTIIQVKQKFGMDVFKKNPEMMDLLNNKPDSTIEIIHSVEPRSRYEIQDKKTISQPFRSVYVIPKFSEVLLQEGFNTNPYMVSRFSKISGEVYGRSPAMKALPDTMSLNELMRTIIQAAQLTVAPPFQVPSDGVLLPLRLKPFGTNVYRSNSKDRIEPMMSNVRPDIAFELLQKLVMNIEQTFFIDQLRLAERAGEMTATEVIQRSEENMRFLSPIVGIQQYEFLTPFILRVYDIMSRRNLLPPAPSIVEDTMVRNNRQLEIRYTSPLARAQKSTEADSFLRMFQMVAPILEIQPDSAKVFAGENIIRMGAKYFNLHNSMLRTPEEVEEIKEKEQTEREQAMAMATAEQASTVAKNMDMGGNIGNE